MEARFNVTKEARKVLVKAVGEISGIAPVYQGAPSFAYAVGDYTIDKHGTLTCSDEAAPADIHHLMVELSSQGFDYEDDSTDDGREQTEESPAGDTADSDPDTVAGPGTAYSEDIAGDHTVTDDPDPDGSFGKLRSVIGEDGLFLTIEAPLDGFTETALENLNKLVSGRAWLIKKALGYESDADVDAPLPIEQTADTLRFPWFPAVSSHDEVTAYSLFVHLLCKRAKKQKRISIREKAQDSDASEKFAFRCFLLQLDFIGKEYGPARKVLLSKLSGNGSFKYGNPNATDNGSSPNVADEAIAQAAPAEHEEQDGGQSHEDA